MHVDMYIYIMHCRISFCRGQAVNVPQVHAMNYQITLPDTGNLIRLQHFELSLYSREYPGKIYKK